MFIRNLSGRSRANHKYGRAGASAGANSTFLSKLRKTGFITSSRLIQSHTGLRLGSGQRHLYRDSANERLLWGIVKDNYCTIPLTCGTGEAVWRVDVEKSIS